MRRLFWLALALAAFQAAPSAATPIQTLNVSVTSCYSCWDASNQTPDVLLFDLTLTTEIITEGWVFHLFFGDFVGGLGAREVTSVSGAVDGGAVSLLARSAISPAPTLPDCSSCTLGPITLAHYDRSWLYGPSASDPLSFGSHIDFTNGASSFTLWDDGLVGDLLSITDPLTHFGTLIPVRANLTGVPEPGTFALLTAGLLVFLRRRAHSTLRR